MHFLTFILRLVNQWIDLKDTIWVTFAVYLNEHNVTYLTRNGVASYKINHTDLSLKINWQLKYIKK